MGLRAGVAIIVLAGLVAGCSPTQSPAPEPPGSPPPSIVENPQPPPAPPPVTPPPPPLTVAEQCAALGAQCGAVKLGTEGASLACGGCGPDEGCGIAGEENRCAPSPHAVRTAWLYTTEHGIRAVAAHPEGGLAFLQQTPGGSAPARLDAEGRLLWAREGVLDREQFYGLSVTPRGELYAWGWVDGVSFTGSNLAVRYTPDGKSRVVVGGCGDECGLSTYLEDAQGGLLHSRANIGGIHVSYVGADGSGWGLDDPWGDEPSPAPFELYEEDLLASGDAFVSVGLPGRVTYWGRDFGAPGEHRFAVLKIAPDGALRWAYETPTIPGNVYGIGVTALRDGSVFGYGGYEGVLEWEGFRLPVAERNETRQFLFELSPAGKLRWVRELRAGGLTIGPRGELALLNGMAHPDASDCISWQVALYSRVGKLEWVRSFENTGCRGKLWWDAVTFVGGDLVLAGSFRGEVDLGTGPLRAPEEDSHGFLLGLRSR